MRALLCLLLAGGCVERAGEHQVDESYIKANLLSAAPSPRYPIGADFGGKVIYLGADVDKTTAALGDHVKVTHYWKVVEPPGAEWRLFTHVNGSAGDWINVDDTKMRKGYGPAKWKAGDIIRDEQVFPILRTWKSPDATIYVGMFRKGGQTEADRMPIRSGPTDGKSRLRVATIKIVRPAARTGGDAGLRGPYTIRKATGPIRIDGKDDEPDWAHAQSTGPFVDAEGGEPVGADTRARLLWDDHNLYVFVDVADKDVASPYRRHDDPLWKADAVELFIDADKNGKGYVELEVSPSGATFDAWFPTVRPRSVVAWDSGMKAGVTVDGTLNKRHDDDKGWKVELAIPLAAVKGQDKAMAVKIPPAPGDTWKLNLVRIERSAKGSARASSWARIPVSDFHTLDRLRLVKFGDSAKAASR